MQPYQMVKDLRSNFEVGSVENVLDGEIDSFIESYLDGYDQKHRIPEELNN